MAFLKARSSSVCLLSGTRKKIVDPEGRKIRLVLDTDVSLLMKGKRIEIFLSSVYKRTH